MPQSLLAETQQCILRALVRLSVVSIDMD